MLICVMCVASGTTNISDSFSNYFCTVGNIGYCAQVCFPDRLFLFFSVIADWNRGVLYCTVPGNPTLDSLEKLPTTTTDPLHLMHALVAPKTCWDGGFLNTHTKR